MLKAYTISLDWNDYVNWNGGTDHYEVIINESSCGILTDNVRLERPISLTWLLKKMLFIPERTIFIFCAV